MLKGISGLLSLLMLASPSYAEETLQGLIANLRQQQSPQNIEKTLAILKHANIDVLGLPCNGLTCQEARLDVVNLDDLLLVLGQLWHKYPEQRRHIERIVLRWNFCDVNYLNVPHNLISSGTHQAVSRQAVGRSEGWPGFNQWGFTEHDPDHRIRPELLVKSDLDARSKRQLLYRIERRQCFPNPWTGQTPYDPETSPYNTFYRQTPKENILWLKTKVKPKTTPIKKEKVKKLPIKKKLKKTVNKPVKQQQAHHVLLPKASAYHVIHESDFISFTKSQSSLRMGSLPLVKNTNSSIRLSPHGLKMSQHLTTHTTSHGLHLVDQLPSAKSHLPEHLTSDHALMSNGMFFTRSLIHGYDNLPLPKGPNVGLTGDVQLRWRLKDNSYALNTSAQWSPYKNFYIHGGLKIPVIGKTRTPTYTWGLGYANWKPGGFSLGLNQWNPQSLNTPPSIKNMDFKLGYNL
ncbi:MAG: hypothetical protein Q9M18_03310, partial [Mariprofundaceae bacterium]|nr:hypothetical protein [Mariprofundaceae bacterium]